MYVLRSQPLTQPARVTRRQTPNALLRLAPLLSLLIALIGWHALALRYPPFILPGPVLVLERLTQRALDGSLVQHAGVTLSQALLGLLMGAGAALMLGVPIAKSPLADRLLSPFVVASQGIPFVAVAPLIFIWFGNGPLAKALVCALVVFFPMTINLVAGLRSAPLVLRDLFRTLRATPLETFLKLELPSAIPFVFAGLRVSVTLSMVGAIAGEFLSASSGLGFLINLGNGTYDTPLVMASVLVTVLLSLSLYGLVRLSERAWSRYA